MCKPFDPRFYSENIMKSCSGAQGFSLQCGWSWSQPKCPLKRWLKGNCAGKVGGEAKQPNSVIRKCVRVQQSKNDKKKKKSQSLYPTVIVCILLTKTMKIWLLDLVAKVMLLVTSLFKVVQGANVSFLALYKVKKKKTTSWVLMILKIYFIVKTQ